MSEQDMSKGLLVTGLGMPESNAGLRLAMKLVEARFKRCGMPMETFYSEWEGREPFNKKYQRITDKVNQLAVQNDPNGPEKIVPVIGISMGFQMALRTAVDLRQSVRGIVGVVPVAIGRGRGFDEQFDLLESWGSKSCGEAVRSVDEYLKPEALQAVRSMAVTGKDELVFAGMSMLPGAVLFPWQEAVKRTPDAPLVTVESPYKSHVLAAACIMLVNTRMLVERFKQAK